MQFASPRIAIVMPRGGRMQAGRLNSMETVAITLNRFSAFKSSTVFVCEEGAEALADPDATICVPAGLGKKAHAAAVLKVLKTYNPDIVEFHQQLCSAMFLARKLPNVRCVFFRHTRVSRSNNPLRRMRRRWRMRVFDRIILVSRTAKDEFLTDYPALRGRAVTISNSIDMSAWRGDVSCKEQLILFSGRALLEKGLDAFCLAIETVLDQAPGWRAALALGEWEMNSAWADECVSPLERFADRVEIHRSAPVSLVQSLNRRAAIAVTPSRVKEAMGLTAMEAMAGGAALISSGRGGLRDASGEYAVYVDPPEANDLADAMLALIKNEGERQTLGRLGQDFVARTHDPAARAAELDQLRRTLMPCVCLPSSRLTSQTPEMLQA